MAYKTTRKAIVDGAENVKSAGYCDLQCLLYNHSSTAYTAGVYGWNFDVYNVYGVTICTGYRGMPGPRLTGITEYESKAKAVLDNRGMTYDEKRNAVEKLLKEFCVLNGGKTYENV
jgi:hypothetical protein